ncbi:MAG TPA: acylphosphatase [Thermoanaerobaculia bacterium]|nr:acylphosphatase [Thermoanaerobaculia bacterium]
MTSRARRAVVSGRVQGVGFRAFAQRAAREAGVRGWVRNLPDGSVETAVEGEEAAVGKYLERLRRGPLAGKVTAMTEEELPPQGFQTFEITG